MNDLNQEPGSAQKRARPDNAFDQTTAAIAGAQARQLDEEDDELLAMAAEVYPSQFAAQIHHTSNNENPNTTADAVNQIFEEEEQPAEEEEPLLFKPYVPPSRNAIDMGAGDCVTVTGPDGERVYCKIENSVDDAVTAFAARSTAPKTGLLSTSIHALIEEVDKDLFQRALAAIPDDDNGGSAAVGSLEGGATTVEVGGGEKVEKLEKQKGKKVSSLWVDQYAPQNFMDLLGNEQINRYGCFYCIGYLFKSVHCALFMLSLLSSFAIYEHNNTNIQILYVQGSCALAEILGSLCLQQSRTQEILLDRQQIRQPQKQRWRRRQQQLYQIQQKQHHR